MRGVEFNLILVIVILAIITLLAVGGYFFLQELNINDYLAPTFQECGREIGALCCNLENTDLEPYCAAGMVCDVLVDTTKLYDEDVLKKYQTSTCVLPQDQFIIMVDQYIYDDSCLNGFVNGVDNSIGLCDLTSVSRDFFHSYMMQNTGGIGNYYSHEDSSLREGFEDCKDVYECTDCGRYYDFKEAFFCNDCSDCEGDECDSCFDCEESVDPLTNQEYADCSLCYDCNDCIIQNDGTYNCDSCDICEACFSTVSFSDMNYCKESDACDDQTCYNNFYCGDSETDYNEEIFCIYCKPKVQTTCEKEMEPQLCQNIKNCIKNHDSRDESCYVLADEYAPLIYHDSDLFRPFTSGANSPEMSYNWERDDFMLRFGWILSGLLQSCQEEELYRVATDTGVSQKVCTFKPNLLNRVNDASGLPYRRYVDDVLLPGFLEDFDTKHNPEGISYSYDFNMQDQKVWFNDCGNLSGLSPERYDHAKRQNSIYNDYLLYNDGKLFNDGFELKDGRKFDSTTMPEGYSIKLIVSDISYFDIDRDSIDFGTDEGYDIELENICDYNLYVCSQPMLVTEDNQAALQIYSNVRDVFLFSMLPGMGDEETSWGEKITRIELGKEKYDMTPEVADYYGLNYSDDEYEVESYLLTFDKLESGPTFNDVSIGNKPMDAEHIASILVAGFRDWAVYMSGGSGQVYDNTKWFVYYGALEKFPSDCNEDNPCDMPVIYDYYIPWDLKILDYFDVPSKYFYLSEKVPEVGKLQYFNCNEDLIGGACNASHTDHPCWGWCKTHEYDLDETHYVHRLTLSYMTGGDDCESETDVDFIDSSGKVVSDHTSYPHMDHTLIGFDPNFRYSDYFYADKLRIKDDKCWVDFSEGAISYNVLNEIMDSKNIYAVETDDGLYHDKIDIYLGYVVKIYTDDSDNKVAVMHPFVKFMES